MVCFCIYINSDMAAIFPDVTWLCDPDCGHAKLSDGAGSQVQLPEYTLYVFGGTFAEIRLA